MAAVHFGRVSNPLKLVFLHANGFCAQAYAEVLEPLGLHVMALDLRGHGRTELAADPRRLVSWNLFRDDVVAFFEAHVERPVMLAGHSLGAVVGMLAAPRLGTRLSGYLGLEPVIFPRAAGMLARLPGTRTLLMRRFAIARAAARRRSHFADRAAALTHYRGRGAYARFPDAVMRDYLAGGLRPDGNGLELSCAPGWEAAIYVAQAHDTLRAARALPRFSRVAFTEHGSPTPRRTQAALARALGPDRVTRLDGMGHLFPLETPGIATQILSNGLREVGFARG